MSHFNQVANEWDNENKVKLMHKLAQEAKKALKLEDNLDILDFGTGTGLFGLEFTDYAKSLTGIDTSEGMLNVFDQKTKEHPEIASKLINLENEDYNDKKFDLIISSMTFHHLDDPEKVLIKLSKMLNTNGKIAIVDLDKEDGTFHPDNEEMGVKHFGFSKDQLQTWAESAQLNFKHQIINHLEKNDKSYQQFLALYSF